MRRMREVEEEEWHSNRGNLHEQSIWWAAGTAKGKEPGLMLEAPRCAMAGRGWVRYSRGSGARRAQWVLGLGGDGDGP